MPVKLEGGDPPNAAEYCPDDRATEATSNSSLSHNAGDDLKRADEHEDEHDCGQESASIGNGPATSVSASRRKKGGRKLAVRTGAKKKQRKSAWQFAPYTRRSSGSRAKTVVGHRPQTRSQSKSQLNSAFEALEIGRCDTEEKPAPAAEPEYTIQEVVLPEKIPEQTSETMSRNRPRGPPTSRDNGLAANEETDMWNKLIQDLRKAKEKNDKQKQLSEQITALNEKIGREGNSKYTSV
jgi:SAGA-associated factor 29